MISTLILIYFDSPQLGHTRKANCIKFQTVYLQTHSVSTIFHIIFQEKLFPCYVLLTDQISLSGCIYFLRYCVIYLL